ncbi:MAG: S41 family peptidase [Bacteroidota bacterium]|nr:S41 family peptidase [Bacteroidota bacterium]
MKELFLSIVLIVMIYPITIAQNLPATPKLISSVPAFGDCNVDTGAIDIIFKFDQDMNSGITFGKTSNFPELNGKPKWIDTKTLLLPVRLYPNKRYSLVLNNTYPMRFASALGMTLNPQELLFQTKPDNSNVKPSQKSNLNIKAFQEFQTFFPKEYSYASMRGIDWNVILKKNRNELEKAQSGSEFAIKLDRLLRIAEDPHLSIVFDGQLLPTKYLNAVEYNYNNKAVCGMLKDLKVAGNNSIFAGIIGNVGYISIGSWTIDPNMLKYKAIGDTSNTEASFDEVLTILTKLPNLIVDVRSNSGGNEVFAKDFASRFINKSLPYEKVMNYNDKTCLFDIEHTKTLEPSTKQMNYTGKIYVLTGPSVFSSNESFVLMMKQVQNAKLVGMKTYGGSGNPIPHKLSNGVIVNLPSWLAYTLDGKLIEGNGVEPDIEFKTTKKDFVTKDALLESVLMMINKKD